jgi:tetratricopeptide (TPR) repeat protein
MNQVGNNPNAARPDLKDSLEPALALRAQGRLPEALAALSVPSEFFLDFYILRGDLELELGRVREAVESYSTVITEEPDHIYAQGQLGLCQQRLENWEAAAEAFAAVLRFDPHRDEFRLNLAGCLLRLQRFGAALECFDKCWSEASLRRALFGKAVALQFLRRFDEAENHYERLLAIDPDAEEALANMISMAMEVFELGRVQKYSQRLLELNSRSAAACKGLALCAIERRDYPAASRYYQQVAELEPGITNPPEESGDAVEYRISRKVFDSLEEARRKQKTRAARAANGPLPR